MRSYYFATSTSEARKANDLHAGNQHIFHQCMKIAVRQRPTFADNREGITILLT